MRIKSPVSVGGLEVLAAKPLREKNKLCLYNRGRELKTRGESLG